MTDDTTNQGIPEPEGDSELIDTEYEIGQDNVEGTLGPFGFDIHNPVFLISGMSIVAFVFYALALPEQSAALFGWLRPAVTATFDWFFLAAANIFVLFCLFLIVSPWGRGAAGRHGGDARLHLCRLVRDAVRRRHGHRADVLRRVRADEPFLDRARRGRLGRRGAHRLGAAGRRRGRRGRGRCASAWPRRSSTGVCTPGRSTPIVALALALFTYNKGLPLTIRSAFYPIFGERVWGWTGHVIDTLAVFATLFGLATSLGFGATQANAGLNMLFGVPVGADHRGDPDHRDHRGGADLGGARPRRRGQGPVRDQHGARLRCCWSSCCWSGRRWRS